MSEEDEYEGALRAVVAAAAGCRSSMGEPADPVGDALIILRGVLRLSGLDEDADDLSDRACLSVVLGVLRRGGAAAGDDFNVALAANGLPWRLVRG